MQRKIIHIDADCFYAAIEMRDDTTLVDKAIAVGGDPDKRGVISTCNYAARRFGVHSAMASKTALRLCPHLLLVPHRFEAYRAASHAMRNIFSQYTEIIEPLSLDEAFLDVSDSRHCRGSATRIAEAIRQQVKREVGITVSAGVAPNKFLAKIASDWRKPDGLFVIQPEEVATFLVSLPVKKLFGVGKVTAANMQRMGINTCGDLQHHSLLALVERFGSFGQRLYDLSRGVDDRPVKPDRIRKSLSVENTYAEDLAGQDLCLQKLPALFVELEQRLSKLGEAYLPVKTFVKVKFADFTSTSLERVGGKVELAVFSALLQEALERKALPVRLLGVGVRFRDMNQNAEQMELF